MLKDPRHGDHVISGATTYTITRGCKVYDTTDTNTSTAITEMRAEHFTNATQWPYEYFTCPPTRCLRPLWLWTDHTVSLANHAARMISRRYHAFHLIPTGRPELLVDEEIMPYPAQWNDDLGASNLKALTLHENDAFQPRALATMSILPIRCLHDASSSSGDHNAEVSRSR